MNQTVSADKTIVLPESIFVRIGSASGKEKISFGLCGSGLHCTITNNARRKVINMHITHEGKGAELPEYLFEMRFFTLKRLFKIVEKEIPVILRKHFRSQTINLGKLKRHAFIFASGNPGPEAEKAIVIIKNKRLRSNKVIKYDTIEKLVKLPGDLPLGTADLYFLFSPKGRKSGCQGFVIRNPASKSRRRYYLMTDKMFRQCSKELMQLLYSALCSLEFSYKEKFLRLLEEKMPDLRSENIAVHDRK